MFPKRSSSPRSAEIIGSNDDLTQEIFLFLPVRSLIRFQLACKRWRSLISSASFSRLHTLHHLRRPQPQPFFLVWNIIGTKLYMCHPTSKKLVPVPFPFPFLRSGELARFAYNEILQSCNGLLLLKCWNKLYGTNFYFVYNPTTKKSREISVNREKLPRLCLVFDPSISPHYKVLRYMGPNSRYVEVYDSETNSWTIQSKISTGPYQIHDGVCMDGGVYFIRYSAMSYCFSPSKDFYEIGKVPRIQGDKYVKESNGHLHYVVLCQNLGRIRRDFVRVFEMNQDDYVWNEQDRVDLGPIFANNGASPVIGVVGVIRGEKEEDSMMLLHVYGKIEKIMIYRFSDKIFEELVEFPSEPEYKVHLYLGKSYQVIDTLAPV